MSAEKTLAQKVRDALAEDHGPGPTRNAGRFPATGLGAFALSSWENDLREWGVVSGLAFALALTERRPAETQEELAERALDAALAAWHVWGGGFSERPQESIALAEREQREFEAEDLRQRQAA